MAWFPVGRWPRHRSANFVFFFFFLCRSARRPEASSNDCNPIAHDCSMSPCLASVFASWPAGQSPR